MSAEKTARTQNRKRQQNRIVRNKTRTAVKSARRTIVTEGTGDVSAQHVLRATRELDKAAQKGIIHKNAAARAKSRLQLRLNKAS